jgi:hypothetical protein
MTSAIEVKRQALLTFVNDMLAHHPAVQGVVGIGSLATGRMHPGSDIDAIIFLEPFDWYIVPAEFLWAPGEESFHSIYANQEDLPDQSVQFDFLRLDLDKWNRPDFAWPEARRYELAAGLLAHDRSGKIESMIDRKTAYPDDLRLERLDESLIWLDQHLTYEDPELRWERLGPAIALDRMAAAYDCLAQALFAYNQCWMPWRNRQMDALLDLAWLPTRFSDKVLAAAHAPSLDFEGYSTQAKTLSDMFEELKIQLVEDGLYDAMPVDQAFIRQHDEPGYAWNMDEWNQVALSRAIAISKRRR